MLSLDPDFLRTFLAISETGGFGAAGERVNKTQSTVSAQMKRLEEVLGVSLFQKEGRRNVLTTDGRKLLEYAASMVRLNEQALHAFRPPEISGTIRIGAVDDYAQMFFPPILEGFAKANPAVMVEVTAGTTIHLNAALAEGRIDAAIVSRRAGETDIDLLRVDRLHWIGGEGHAIHYNDPLPVAGWTDGCAWREMGLAALAAAGRAARLCFTTSNTTLMTSMIRRGFGVGIAPRWYLSEGLEIIDELDLQCPLGHAEIGIRRRPGIDDPALEAFLSYLESHFRLSTLAA